MGWSGRDGSDVYALLGDIELPDEDELAEDSADHLPIDATSQSECKDDEE